MSHPGYISYAQSRGDKLGYYRASVACDYCRKRKARCLPHFEDKQGRCANCVRLGRQCVAVKVEVMQALDMLGEDATPEGIFQAQCSIGHIKCSSSSTGQTRVISPRVKKPQARKQSSYSRSSVPSASTQQISHIWQIQNGSVKSTPSQSQQVLPSRIPDQSMDWVLPAYPRYIEHCPTTEGSVSNIPATGLGFTALQDTSFNDWYLPYPFSHLPQEPSGSGSSFS